MDKTFICPHCGEKTAAKKKNVMSGWQLTGTVEVCALCGGELPAADVEAERKSDVSALAALLGESVVEAPHLTPGDCHGEFCRNCSAFVAHPFKSMCALHRREADPGGECPEFRPVKTTRDN